MPYFIQCNNINLKNCNVGQICLDVLLRIKNYNNCKLEKICLTMNGINGGNKQNRNKIVGLERLGINVVV